MTKLIGYKQSKEHIRRRVENRKLTSATHKHGKRKQIKCKACKQYIPKEEFDNLPERKICKSCDAQTTICECGCNTTIPLYTASGNIRIYKDKSHAGKGIWNKLTENEKAEKANNFKDYNENTNLSFVNKQRWENSEYKNKMLLIFKLNSKENHPMWNGGTSFLPYDDKFNENFKRFIRERQNYICADIELGNCNNDNKRALQVHHIDRNKKNTTPENCIALCVRHHSRAHNETARIRHRKYNEKFK